MATLSGLQGAVSREFQGHCFTLTPTVCAVLGSSGSCWAHRPVLSSLISRVDREMQAALGPHVWNLVPLRPPVAGAQQRGALSWPRPSVSLRVPRVLGWEARGGLAFRQPSTGPLSQHLRFQEGGPCTCLHLSSVWGLP